MARHGGGDARVAGEEGLDALGVDLGIALTLVVLQPCPRRAAESPAAWSRASAAPPAPVRGASRQRCRSRRRSRAGSPRRRARRLRIALRTASRESGSTPLPAIAPKSTALITVPLSCASLRMSNITAFFASRPPAATTLVAVEAAVGHLHLLHRGVDAVRRGDERGALGADVAVLHRAAGLDQLGGDHDVDVAGAGVSESTGSLPFRVDFLSRKDLQVVRRRAGALRDARNGRRLRGIGRSRWRLPSASRP